MSNASYNTGTDQVMYPPLYLEKQVEAQEEVEALVQEWEQDPEFILGVLEGNENVYYNMIEALDNPTPENIKLFYDVYSDEVQEEALRYMKDKAEL